MITSFISPYIAQFKLLIYLIIALIVFSLFGACIWVYKDWKYQISENIRQTENASQVRKLDSLKFASQLLSKEELAEYLTYQNKELKKNLEKDKIDYKRISSIIAQTFKYIDTTRRETDVSGMIEAINNKVPKSQSWSDSTKCQIIKGLVTYDGSKLKVVVTERSFENKTDAVAYWERRQWKFLGIKTRVFGKKQATSVTYNQCGETKTMKIDIKKEK